MNDIKKEVIIKKSTNRLKNRDYKLIRKYIAKLSITRRQRSFSFSMFILRVVRRNAFVSIRAALPLNIRFGGACFRRDIRSGVVSRSTRDSFDRIISREYIHVSRSIYTILS